MGNVLSAIITADGSKFTKTLGDLQGQLKRFEASLKQADSIESFNRINRAIDATKQRIAQLNNVGASFRPIAKGSKEASIALIDLSRIIQDAPYAILAGNISAVANNFDPLVQSAGRASKAAGGFSQGLAAMGKSLIGPGGIGLAVSLVSSALVLFGDKIFGSGKAFSQAEIDMANFKIGLDKLNDSLDTFKNNIEFGTAFDRLMREVRGLEGIDLSLFDAKRVKEDSDAVIAENKRAIEKLTKQKDDAFFALTSQGRGAELVRIFSSDMATIPDNMIQELSKSEQTLVTTVKETAKKIQDLTKENLAELRKFAIQDFTITKLNNEKAKAEREKALKDFEEFANKRIKFAKDLAGQLDKTTIREFDFDVDPTKSLLQNLRSAEGFIQKALDLNQRREFKIKPNLVVDFNVKFKGISETLTDDEFAKQTFPASEVTKTYDQLKAAFETAINRKAEANPFVLQLAANVKIGQDFEARLKEAADQINKAATSFIGDAFASIGESIGNVISGKDFGKSFVDVLAGFITQIGKALIEFGIIKTGLDKILKVGLSKIPGPAAIALGVAAIAIGGILRNSFKGVDGFRAAGGPVGAGKSYVVGERGPELFVPNTGGRIIPNNQIGTGRMASASGVGAISLNGKFVIQGRDLVYLLNLENLSQGRTT